MTGPSLILSALLLPLALFAYCWRHRNDPPFREQWYRSCGRNPSSERGSSRK